MVWSESQRMRLAIEKEKLEKYFRLGITWIDPQHETKVEVLVRSNMNREYILRIYIPQDFPNSCPVLVVTSPLKLQLRNGSRLPEASDSFHTLVDTDGFHRICHFYPPDWTQDITLFQVFMKGRLWIEGYEAHLRTGMKMNEYLGEHKFAAQSGQNNQQQLSTLPSSSEPERGESLLVGSTQNQTRSNSFSRFGYQHEQAFIEPTAIYERDTIEETDYDPAFYPPTVPVQRVLPEAAPALPSRRTLNETLRQNVPLDTINNNETSSPSETINPSRYRPPGGIAVLPPIAGRNARLRRPAPQVKPKPRS